MNTSLAHLQINVSSAERAIPFYKDFFSYFKYRIIDESAEHLGVSNGGTDFWIIQTEEGHRAMPFHRKGTGLNHIAFSVESREEVDRFCAEFLKTRGIATLYASPKLFPEYTPGYYAVFFEGPDRLKIEVMAK